MDNHTLNNLIFKLCFSQILCDYFLYAHDIRWAPKYLKRIILKYFDGSQYCIFPISIYLQPFY